MRSIVLALTLLVCVLTGVARADEVTPRETVVSGVVVRAGPSTAAQRLALLRPDERVELVGDEPDWWRVRLADGRTGYVSKRWTRRIETAAPPVSPLATASAEMFAHFVYVGQGDGAILEFPCGVAVIDTGGQYRSGTNGGLLFATYLERFFAARPHLDRTIDVLFTTHPHADHLNGLAYLLDEEGALRYRVRNVVDNGQSGESGSLAGQSEFRDAVIDAGGGYFASTITDDFTGRGVTNHVVDPLDCSAEGVDPVITLYWGGWEVDVVRELGGRGSHASNPNNHSLVVRIDFGEASFLFTGDLESHAIEDMLELYSEDLGVFDVDVYQVGHHGSANATTEDLLLAMSPEIAIISMGNRDNRGPSSARDYGHPRRAVIDMMQTAPGVVSGRRDQPAQFWSFTEARGRANATTIEHAIYATGWEGDLILRATRGGALELIDEP